MKLLKAGINKYLYKGMMLLLCGIMLAGCSRDFSVEEDLTLIYSLPYNYDYTDIDEKLLTEKFDGIFNEDELNRHISEETFVLLNECNDEISVDYVELEETADDQYNFIVELSTKDEKYTSTGSIHYEKDKISYFSIDEYPEYD